MLEPGSTGRAATDGGLRNARSREAGRARAARGPREAAFRKAPAYTLSCTGTFNVTTGSETKGGSHAFSMTVDPAEDVAYMFDFVSTGYFNSRHRAMNNEISRISNVSDERIFIGSFELNRRTGKYTFDGDFTVGTCEKAENVTPVPQQKF